MMTHPDVDHYREASDGAVVEPPHGEEHVAAMVPAATVDAGHPMPAAVAGADPEAVVAGWRRPRKNPRPRHISLVSRSGQAVLVTTPPPEARGRSPPVVSPPRIWNAATWPAYWDGSIQDGDWTPAPQPALRFAPPKLDTPSSDDIATEDGVEVDARAPRSQSPCPLSAVASSPVGAPAVAEAREAGQRRAEQQRAATAAGETRNKDGTTFSLIDVDPDPRWPGANLVTMEEPEVAGGAFSVIAPAAGLTPMGLSLVGVYPDPRWPGAVLVTVEEPTGAAGAVGALPPAISLTSMGGTLGVPPHATAHVRAEPRQTDPAAIKPATGRASTTAACAALKPAFPHVVPDTPATGRASAAGRSVRRFDTCCDDCVSGGCEEAHGRRSRFKPHERRLLVRFFPDSRPLMMYVWTFSEPRIGEPSRPPASVPPMEAFVPPVKVSLAEPLPLAAPLTVSVAAQVAAPVAVSADEPVAAFFPVAKQVATPGEAPGSALAGTPWAAPARVALPGPEAVPAAAPLSVPAAGPLDASAAPPVLVSGVAPSRAPPSAPLAAACAALVATHAAVHGATLSTTPGAAAHLTPATPCVAAPALPPSTGPVAVSVATPGPAPLAAPLVPLLVVAPGVVPGAAPGMLSHEVEDATVAGRSAATTPARESLLDPATSGHG